ncbi:hypothetical protein MRX96_049577 [Rhipicephalus microplus]
MAAGHVQVSGELPCPSWTYRLKVEGNSGLASKRQEPGGESLWAQTHHGRKTRALRGLPCSSKKHRPDMESNQFDLAPIYRW